MRSRIIFAALMSLLLIVLSPHVLWGQKQVQNQLSLKQQVDMELFNLTKNVAAADSLQEKLSFISIAESRIIDLRQKNANQPLQEEMYLDVLMASLNEIPRKKTFQKEKCHVYRQNIFAKYDPMAGERAPHPAVEKAIGVLGRLCPE